MLVVQLSACTALCCKGHYRQGLSCMHPGASLPPALLPFLDELELRLWPLMLLRKANPSSDFPRCLGRLLQQKREFLFQTWKEGSNQRVHVVSAFHVTPQPQILLFMPPFSPPCTRPHSGRPCSFLPTAQTLMARTSWSRAGYPMFLSSVCFTFLLTRSSLTGWRMKNGWISKWGI